MTAERTRRNRIALAGIAAFVVIWIVLKTVVTVALAASP